jgi:hypothetical protein
MAKALAWDGNAYTGEIHNEPIKLPEDKILLTPEYRMQLGLKFDADDIFSRQGAIKLLQAVVFERYTEEVDNADDDSPFFIFEGTVETAYGEGRGAEGRWNSDLATDARNGISRRSYTPVLDRLKLWHVFFIVIGDPIILPD